MKAECQWLTGCEAAGKCNVWQYEKKYQMETIPRYIWNHKRMKSAGPLAYHAFLTESAKEQIPGQQKESWHGACGAMAVHQLHQRVNIVRADIQNAGLINMHIE